MNFYFELTVPAGTPKASPVMREIKLPQGVIYDMKITSMLGTLGYVFCYITDIYGRKIFPREGSDDYRLNGTTIGERYPAAKYDLAGTNSIIRFYGYSPDAIYDHTIGLLLWVVDKDEIPFLERVTKNEVSGILGQLQGIGRI